MTLTESLMGEHNADSEPSALEFSSNSCLNCCQELLCSTSCSSGNESVIGAGVVAFTSFVKNVETQVSMRDALQSIYSSLNGVELENCALCVDCSLVFAQLFGLFHAFESRRKSNGLLDLILSDQGLEWDLEFPEGKREFRSGAEESHEETNEDDFQTEFENSAEASEGCINLEFQENDSQVDECDRAEDLITVQVLPKADLLADECTDGTNEIDDGPSTIEETTTVCQKLPISVTCVPEIASTSKHSEVREAVTPEKDQLFKCVDCCERFSTETGLGRHRIDLHGAKENPYVCHICLYNSKKLGALKVHILRHISTEEHKCSKCGKNFKIFKSLQVHMKNQHGINLRSSHYSSRQTVKAKKSQNKNLNKNLPKLSKCQVVPPTAAGALQCTQCPLAFDTQIEFAAHLTCQHKKFKCELCGKLFLTKYKLRDHERYMHGQIRCIHCKKSVKRVSMAGHLTEAHPEKKRMKALVKAKRRSRRIVSQQRKTNRDVQYCCSDCPEKFNNLKNFRIHRMAHTKNVEDILKCNICHKSFLEDAGASSFRRHIQLHDVSTDWPCAHCSMRFVMRRQRNEHQAQIHGVEQGDDSNKDTTFAGLGQGRN